MKKAKHNGCAICGSTEQEILVSIMVKGKKMSQAVCDKCRKNLEAR